MNCKYSLRSSFILLLFIVVVSWCEPQAQSQESQEAEFLTYENFDYGVKIGYPANWEQTETEEAIVAFITPKINSEDTGNNLNLIMNDFSGQEMTLDKYNENVLAQLNAAFPEMVLEESEPITLAGSPGHKIVYLASNLKFLQAWTIKNDISYIWTYVSYPGSFATDEPLINKMLDTFEITRDIRQTEEEPVEEQEAEPLTTGNANPSLVGKWRAYSERLYYDAGGGGVTTTTGRRLLLNEDGSWEFGSSTGAWSASDITSEDWTRWGIDSYGPARKIILENWNNDASADGPIEGSVDFIWVIYRVEPPLVSDPGTVWIKFGH